AKLRQHPLRRATDADAARSPPVGILQKPVKPILNQCANDWQIGPRFTVLGAAAEVARKSKRDALAGSRNARPFALAPAKSSETPLFYSAAALNEAAVG